MTSKNLPVSKERNPPHEAPSKPAPRERELAPPIFWGATDDEPKTLSAPIYLVHVFGFEKGGERVPLDCTPLDGLPTHAHELGGKYGMSPIELVARDEKGAVVARVTHRTLMAAAPPATAASPAQAPPATAPTGMDPLALMLAMNERTDKLMAMLLASKESSHAQIIDAISKMSGARLTDAQELFSTLLKSKTPTAAPSSAGELAAFKQGMSFFEKLVDAGREAEGGESGEDWTQKLESFTRALQAVQGLGGSGAPQQPPLRVVNTEGTP
jgi:hypothetical protein